VVRGSARSSGRIGGPVPLWSHYTELAFRLSRAAAWPRLGGDQGAAVMKQGEQGAGAGTSADRSPQGPKRSDALKNRQKILLAAQAIFSSEGLAVPIDVVAERAGVGVGTLYRNFPTKEALFEAIVVETLQGLVKRAGEYEESGDPGSAFFSFLEEFVVQATKKRDLRDALDAAGIDFKSRFAGSVDELERCVGRLLQQAVDAGAVRNDVTTAEVMALVTGACHAAEHSGLEATCCLHMIQVVSDGLRATERDGPANGTETRAAPSTAAVDASGPVRGAHTGPDLSN
jgi:AcrR family transcriptional regulator